MKTVTGTNLQKIFCHVIVWTLFVHILCHGAPPPCHSDIYCHGPILEAIQMARTFKDSKDFVDMKMKNSPQKTKEAFENFMKDFTNRKPNKKELRQFVAQNFDLQGNEFESWTPSDWTATPKILDGISDPDMRRWASRLNDIWHDLGRKIKNDVKHNQDLYSLIWVPNPTIVPGGRFREFYYWDSYWIIKGLLLCEMDTTVKGMLENFLYMVKHYGLVPNGGRIYYLGRSQPPLLIPMIKLYYDYTEDLNFVYDNIHIMEKEFMYWMSNHTKKVSVKGKTYTLATYGGYTSGPRPESYVEDVMNARAFSDQSKKEEFYSHLKAAAESGWDFSSRWFIKDATNKGNLTDIKTEYIVPVDLNAIIYWNAKILSEFFGMSLYSVKYRNRTVKYNNIASQWLTAVTDVLWHEDVGSWLDYDLINNVRRNYFFPSNIFPLWTGCYNSSDRINKVDALVKHLIRTKFLLAGGVPTTFYETGEQWDFPNAWPPLQHVMVMSLQNSGHEKAMELALRLARIWIASNYAVYTDKGDMMEKYDARNKESGGFGGEYAVQLGFGWSNGVILDLLDTYGERVYANSAEFSAVEFNSLLMVVKLICLLFIINMIV